MRALVIATVAKSLAFQAPTMWPILQARGYDLTFAAAPDRHVDVLEQLGTFQPLRLDRGLTTRSLGGMSQLRGLLGQEWELLQLQTPVASSLARIMRKSMPAPSLYVAHGLHATRDLPRRTSAVFQGVEHALARRTSAVAVVCQEDFELAQRLGWGKRSLIWRLPGAGVSTSRFAGVDARAGRRIALFVGELNRNKKIDFAVDVAEQLVREQLVDSFVVIGDGPLQTALEDGIRDGWIEHHPYRPDVHLFYRDAAVLLHTSVREGLPRVIIEAHAAGVPVLARSNRGSRELVVPGTGALMDPDASLGDWVSSYRALDADDASMRANAERYDVAHFEQSYQALLDQLEAGVTRGYADLDDQS